MQWDIFIALVFTSLHHRLYSLKPLCLQFPLFRLLVSLRNVPLEDPDRQVVTLPIIDLYLDKIRSYSFVNDDSSKVFGRTMSVFLSAVFCYRISLPVPLLLSKYV